MTWETAIAHAEKGIDELRRAQVGNGPMTERAKHREASRALLAGYWQKVEASDYKVPAKYQGRDKAIVDALCSLS